jgi:hypothetical protein
VNVSKTLIRLSAFVAVLALGAAAAGLFWQDGGGTFAFTTLHGQTVQIYGQGLYHYDSVVIATGYRVADAFTLIVAIPLLVLAVLLYRIGSLRGGLLLTGTLAYFAYNYGSLAFGAAYNNLFLVYIALVAASLLALAVALTSFDIPALPMHFSAQLPRRSISVFLILSGAVLYAAWLGMIILPALWQGKAPDELGAYTTAMTIALDLGLLAPALIVSGFLLRQRTPIGYLLASILLVFSVVLGVQLAAMGTVQFLAGLFGVGQFIGMVLSFAILALCALWLTIGLFRSICEADRSKALWSKHLPLTPTHGRST